QAIFFIEYGGEFSPRFAVFPSHTDAVILYQEFIQVLQLAGQRLLNTHQIEIEKMYLGGDHRNASFPAVAPLGIVRICISDIIGSYIQFLADREKRCNQQRNQKKTEILYLHCISSFTRPNLGDFDKKPYL